MPFLSAARNSSTDRNLELFLTGNWLCQRDVLFMASFPSFTARLVPRVSITVAGGVAAAKLVGSSLGLDLDTPNDARPHHARAAEHAKS